MLAPTAERQREIIGERTLLQRRRVKRSQRPLAAALGWGPNRISQIEHAEVDIDTLELYNLAAALDCTAEYLLGLVADPKATSQSRWSVDSVDDLLVSAA